MISTPVMPAYDKQFWRCMILASFFIALCPTAALGADTIRGVVRNKTSGQSAVGDEVFLLRLTQSNSPPPGLQPSMQEEARTQTDAQSSFTLDVKHPSEPHVVRVVHRGVNYDQQTSAGKAISIDVFDAVSKVQGVTGSIEIIRIGAQGNHLHVSDMIEIRNDSSPPLTQAGSTTFETYLPAHAKLDSVLAAGPGKIASLISATSVRGEPGHYAVNFPLQPGATKFAFNYDVPYAGHATFRARNMYPLQQLAVMIPPTMKFTSPSAAFQTLPTGNDRYQVEAANLVSAGKGPEFEISGVGPLPALRGPVPVQPVSAPTIALKSQSAVPVATGSHAAASTILAQPFQMSSEKKWRVLVIGVVMLGAGGVLFWRRQRLNNATPQAVRMKALHMNAPQTPGQPGNSVAFTLDALTAELRQLEIDRSFGTITGEEYASAKQALEGTVKRALARRSPLV